MQETLNKAKDIKLLILDVDGILTNGSVYYDREGHILKAFHIHDGMGIKLLHDNQIETALLSSKNSEAVRHRAKELGIKHIHLGHSDKLPVYEEIKKLTGLTDKNIAYMGDDLPDLPLLRRAGLAITVPQAPKVIQQHADMITEKKAGKGAVREACELILEAKGLLQQALAPYLTG
jgi:3-deoxy-D-manno-octulosonate 8-phosphate phosphatase (KDO 8-P phosphatase)